MKHTRYLLTVAALAFLASTAQAADDGMLSRLKGKYNGNFTLIATSSDGDSLALTGTAKLRLPRRAGPMRLIAIVEGETVSFGASSSITCRGNRARYKTVVSMALPGTTIRGVLTADASPKGSRKERVRAKLTGVGVSGTTTINVTGNFKGRK